MYRRYEVLASDQATTLIALLDTLIPSDELGPGAVDAGVDRYIDGVLSTEVGDGETSLSALFLICLEATDALAAKTYGASFAELDPEQRAALLTEIESGTATGFTPSSSEFFILLRALTMQGMFGDPVHGGNQDYIGWKLIGYPGPRASVPAELQMLDVHIPSAYGQPGDRDDE